MISPALHRALATLLGRDPPFEVALEATHDPDAALRRAWAACRDPLALVDVHALTLPVGVRRTYGPITRTGRIVDGHYLLRVGRHPSGPPWLLLLEGVYAPDSRDPERFMSARALHHDDEDLAPGVRLMLPRPTAAAIEAAS